VAAPRDEPTRTCISTTHACAAHRRRHVRVRARALAPTQRNATAARAPSRRDLKIRLSAGKHEPAAVFLTNRAAAGARWDDFAEGLDRFVARRAALLTH
jgi:hypothetical protein